MLRELIPNSWKLTLRLARRVAHDARSGVVRSFAKPAGPHSFQHSLNLTQPVLNATTEQSRQNKVHNIKIAAASIEQIIIAPGEVFSFWRAVGRPSERNNYRKGINIIRGTVIEDFGGGLCQLSSIIYHLSLKAGLNVVEHFNHSVDLYQDQQRYTPLGSDATVFYGYKDLRLRNDFDHPVSFRFIVQEETLQCFLESPVEIHETPIDFQTIYEDERIVTVLVEADGKKVSEATYQKGENDKIVQSKFVAPDAQPKHRSVLDLGPSNL